MAVKTGRSFEVSPLVCGKNFIRRNLDTSDARISIRPRTQLSSSLWKNLNLDFWPHLACFCSVILAANPLGVKLPGDECGRPLLLYSFHFVIAGRVSARDENRVSVRHSSRKLPLNLSMKAFCGCLPRAIQCQPIFVFRHHFRTAELIISVPVAWSVLPERSKEDDDLQRDAGRTAEGLRAA